MQHLFVSVWLFLHKYHYIITIYIYTPISISHAIYKLWGHQYQWSLPGYHYYVYGHQYPLARPYWIITSFPPRLLHHSIQAANITTSYLAKGTSSTDLAQRAKCYSLWQEMKCNKNTILSPTHVWKPHVSLCLGMHARTHTYMPTSPENRFNWFKVSPTDKPTHEGITKHQNWCVSSQIP